MTASLPAPTTPDPMDAPPTRWGVMAPGGIAHAFAEDLLRGTRQTIAAVGSRSLDRAQAFADRFGATHAYGSYEELAAEPDVDVVYVASPHSEHLAHALTAIEAGKPVLVEKAFTRNAAEARQVIDAAKSMGLFVMEAMWSRHLPHIDVVRQAVGTGLLGEVHTVMADHGQYLYPDGPERLSSPDLAGGALLDLGVYPIAFTSMVLGEFLGVTAVGTLTDAGVDAQDSITVTTAAGAHGLISASMVAKTPTTASVSGTFARLELTGDFYQPATVRLLSPGGELLDVFEPSPAQAQGGLRYEAAEVARALADGLTESSLMPVAETVRIMETMDEIRRQIGVRYPGEESPRGAAGMGSGPHAGR